MEQGILTAIIALGVPVLAAFVYACIWRRDALLPLVFAMVGVALIMGWIRLAMYIDWLVTR